MKKWIAILLAAMIFVSLLAACTTTEPTPNENTPSANEDAANNTTETPSQVTTPDTNDTNDINPVPTPDEGVTGESEIVVEADKTETDNGNDDITVDDQPATMPTTPSEDKKEETKPTTSDKKPSETPIVPPSSGNTPDTGTKELSAIADEMYKSYAPLFPVGSMNADINDADSVAMFTGLQDTSMITDVYASESMMGSQAYSLVFVRLKNATDAQTVAQAMRNGIDMRKWICVGADTIRVVAAGDVVMLCMVDSSLGLSVDSFADAFGKVMNLPFSADIK